MQPPVARVRADLTAAASACTLPDSQTLSKSRSTQPASRRTEKTRAADSAQHMQQNQLRAMGERPTRTNNQHKSPRRAAASHHSAESLISQSHTAQTLPASRTAAQKAHHQEIGYLCGRQYEDAHNTCYMPRPPQQAITSQHSAEPRIHHALDTQTRPASRNTTRRTHSKQIAYWLHVACLACLIGLPLRLTSENTARSTVRENDKNDYRMTIEMTIEMTTGMTTRMTIEKPTDDKDAKMTAPHITHTTPHIAYPKPHPTPPSDRKRTKK